MKAIMFPGQGSQYRGMGKEIFPKFQSEIIRASEILGYDLQELCLTDPQRQLHKTQYTQPALYVVNALSYENLEEKLIDKSDFLLGHSLGEYNALLAAGVFDFETGLRLVQKRGELMGKASGGGMAAILGVKVSEINEIITDEGLSDIDIANYNTPTQTILAGKMDDIIKSIKIFEARNIKCIPLNVSAPFHSRYMKEASEEFSVFLDSVKLLPPNIPVVANAMAKLYQGNHQSLKSILGLQIANSVKWNESIEFLLEKGVLNFEEIGVQNILTKMVEEIKETYIPKPTNQDNSIRKNSNTQETVIQKKPYSGKSLGNLGFKKSYGLEYAYIAGSMYRGIASRDLVVKMANSGLMSYLGIGGMSISEVEEEIIEIKKILDENKPFGINLLCNIQNPDKEMQTVQLFLKHGIDKIEASGFMQITLALGYYCIKGLYINKEKMIDSKHKVMAKVSRPEVAELFMKPIPEKIVESLLKQQLITQEEAKMSQKISVSGEICIEADSGGHTDGGIATVLMPSIRALKNRIEKQYNYYNPIYLGQAGGIGTPDAAAAAFIMGADFILTGSINQCSLEAGISDTVKTILQDIDVQDTEYAPAGDMFEIGAKVQVLKKGTLFPARANKLYNLYNQYNSLEEIPDKNLKQLENVFFKRELDEIWEEAKSYKLSKGKENEIKRAEENPKIKMAMIFKWYFVHSMKLSFEGDITKKINYQVHTGPAIGAFNQWVKNTKMQDWKNRHVDQMGIKIMNETSEILKHRLESILA
ncbi:ACP S-malonyltransferase [Aquimarina aggregata]|uniref:ACP S-malonyltransferase n=1 Tax=Aquimarina aggregata TaxID=1642818 RepID=UPI00248FC106|nr:ACP S-malonyltransferase [Aquimarina aggregata]